MGWGLGDQSQEPPCLLLKSLLLACGHCKAGGAGSSMRSPSSLVWPLGSEGQLSGLWQSYTLVLWQVVCVWGEGSAAQQGCQCQPGMGLEGVWTAQSITPCASPLLLSQIPQRPQHLYWDANDIRGAPGSHPPQGDRQDYLYGGAAAASPSSFELPSAPWLARLPILGAQ